MKELSVIVAAQNARTTIAECLSTLERQNNEGLAEILVVDNSSDGTARLVEEKFPSLRLIKITEPMLVPELWALGARQASARVVAFTIADCIPGDHWLSEMVLQHRSEHAAIGGAIENVPSASPAHWAVYFCRYAPYMLPFESHLVGQVAGDNASYKRWVLKEYAGMVESGFWENDVNRRLRQDGHAMMLVPSIRVSLRQTPGVLDFCRRRFVHGRVFGAERVAASPPVRRLIYLAASPLVPFVSLAKITRQVFRKRRNRLAFFGSLPFVILFVLSWSLGEFVGYATGYAHKEDPTR